jgi:hypothetical protein
MIGLFSSHTFTASSTPSEESGIKYDTDAQIYREYEICMHNAEKTLADDKLKGREMALNCYGQLRKYGEERTKKAMATYYDLDYR